MCLASWSLGSTDYFPLRNKGARQLVSSIFFVYSTKAFKTHPKNIAKIQKYIAVCFPSSNTMFLLFPSTSAKGQFCHRLRGAKDQPLRWRCCKWIPYHVHTLWDPADYIASGDCQWHLDLSLQLHVNMCQMFSMGFCTLFEMIHYHILKNPVGAISGVQTENSYTYTAGEAFHYGYLPPDLWRLSPLWQSQGCLTCIRMQVNAQHPKASAFLEHKSLQLHLPTFSNSPFPLQGSADGKEPCKTCLFLTQCFAQTELGLLLRERHSNTHPSRSRDMTWNPTFGAPLENQREVTNTLCTSHPDVSSWEVVLCKQDFRTSSVLWPV